MTFAAHETSIQSGAPIELYEFTVGPTRYRYTSAPDDYEFQTKIFEAVQIIRGAIEESGEIPKTVLTVNVPRDAAIADEFRVAPPSEVIVLDLYRMHYDDANLERVLFWTGRVLNCEWKGPTAELTCESFYTALRRAGLRRLYQRQCPHVLFGAACGLQDTAWKTPIVLTSASGTTVVGADFALQPDGYYSGGMLEFEASPGRFDRRAIREHVGDTITMTHPIVDLGPGATVDAWPGCDHTIGTCSTKFSNILNYGGFPYVPKKNPFSGTNVY